MRRKITKEDRIEKEFSDKRFGIAATEIGFITKDELIHAMEIQIEENINKKIHRPIGAILLSEGHINQTQLIEIITAIGNERGEIKGKP